MLASDRPTDRDNRLTRDTTRIHIDQAPSHGAGQLTVPVRRPTEAHLHRPPDVSGQAMSTNHNNERVARWTNNALK